MPDYIPQNDAELNVWQENLLDIVEPNIPTWGILADDFTLVKSKQTAWLTSYGAANNKANRTTADVLAKDDASIALKKAIRSFVAQWLASNTKVSDSDRIRMGLNVRIKTRTLTPTPTTCPVGTVDFSSRQQHSINFHDEASAHSNAKPTGVHGCEVYMKLDGAAPTDISELMYSGICT